MCPKLAIITSLMATRLIFLWLYFFNILNTLLLIIRQPIVDPKRMSLESWTPVHEYFDRTIHLLYTIEMCIKGVFTFSSFMLILLIHLQSYFYTEMLENCSDYCLSTKELNVFHFSINVVHFELYLKMIFPWISSPKIDLKCALWEYFQ